MMLHWLQKTGAGKPITLMGARATSGVSDVGWIIA